MYNVKFTFPYPEWPILRQTPGSNGIWKDYRFIVNDKDLKECDFWVVFEDILIEEKIKCKKENIIFIGGEGSATGTYNEGFLNQFGHVITCQDRILHPGKFLFHTANPWFVGKTYDELINTSLIKKKKNLSLVCSNKQFTDGHKLRFDFCMKLKDYFGKDLDLFGRGINDFNDKWEVLEEYKYSIAIENLVEKNWFTEKIYDCFLAHTIPFYYGCPNISSYFPKNSVLDIDLNNFEYSKRIIESTLNDQNNYEKLLPKILENKIKYLNNYNIFPLVTNFIEARKLNVNKNSSKRYSVYKKSKSSFSERMKQKAFYLYERIHKKTF